MNRQSTEDFQGIAMILYDIIMMDTCNFAFVKMHRMYYTI
jgi:hypothetical protein